ncbi:MAG: hypothetical protein ACTSYS_00595 [Promethearchaeota archaeon]
MESDKPKPEDLDKVKTFLEEKDLRYEIVDEKTIIVPYEIKGKLFKPMIQIHGKWLVVSALIVNGDDLPSKDEKYLFELFKKLLIAIHDLPEINYDIDSDYSVYTSVDMRLEITDFNNFFSEFFAVPYGIKYFIENIAPEMDPKIEVKSLEE